MGDENDQNGRVSGAIAGREQDQNTPAACHGFLRGSGPDQQAHEQTEIVPGDMDQIALVDVLPAPQPCPAQATSIQNGPVTAKVCVLAKALRNTRFVKSAAPDPQQNQALRPSFPSASDGEVCKGTIDGRSRGRSKSWRTDPPRKPGHTSSGKRSFPAPIVFG